MKSDYNISEYISKLNVEIPPEEEFKKIAQIFKIYPNESKENALVNYERGMLLYGLISKYKPKTILEIGRAQGYSTMCMAWALCENKIDGKIISVDPLSYENSIEWLIDWDGKIKTEKKNNLFQKENLSVTLKYNFNRMQFNKIFKKILSFELRKKLYKNCLHKIDTKGIKRLERFI